MVELLRLPYRLGDYELVAVIGQGGMGVVYRARHRSLESDAAVKVLNPAIAYHPSARQRFLQEARITAALRHENVVRVVHVGEAGAILYLVMELLEGESLAARLANGPPLTMADTARIGREVASALAEAHRRNLVHRDIKPGNIFLERREGAAPRTKLLDFGIARREDAESSLTSLHALIGTPRYMAPEQTNDSHVGSPADVFSLGSVLYELASGQSPFLAGSHAAVFRRVAEYDPPPLKESRPDTPERLSSLIHNCLRKDPALRPSAKVVEEQLTGVETDPDSRAWLQTAPPPPDCPTETWVRPSPARPRRRRLLAGLAAVVGVALLSVGGYCLWPSRQGNPPPLDVPPPRALIDDQTQTVLTRWKMGDPPPFEEWLRGRRIRTVRQKGEAEFQSLTAALAAVNAGEAIELLDAGPYTELDVLPDGSWGWTVPKDVGLFSRTGTVLLAQKYVVDSTIPSKNGRVCYNGPKILAESGLRLHGLTFQADAPPDDTEDASAWGVLLGGPCVIEDCLFLRPQAPRPEKHFKVLSLNFTPTVPTQLALRRCWLEGTLNTHYRNPAVRIEARVENCVFGDAAQNLWLKLANTRWAFVENVFQAGDVCAAIGTDRYRPNVGQPELLFGRNTFLARRRSPLRVERYEKGPLAPIRASLFDNSFESEDEESIHFAVSQDARESRVWATGGNWSSGRSGVEWFPMAEGKIQFASRNPLDPTFAQIVNDPPAVPEKRTRFPGAIQPDSAPPGWLRRLQDRRRAAVP
ncbi:serine/threonine-protein kinase [Limnoglobus roseus]|uniref:serine/threonine-protein kinase n=1 Tax=Limnoglobus roseus TaxID=2598579 RepID=UPI00143DE200|nr:serine/threonine-protein kinase [Limnoglobus roseus]